MGEQVSKSPQASKQFNSHDTSIGLRRTATGSRQVPLARVCRSSLSVPIRCSSCQTHGIHRLLIAQAPKPISNLLHRDTGTPSPSALSPCVLTIMLRLRSCIVSVAVHPHECVSLCANKVRHSASPHRTNPSCWGWRFRKSTITPVEQGHPESLPHREVLPTRRELLHTWFDVLP